MELDARLGDGERRPGYQPLSVRASLPSRAIRSVITMACQKCQQRTALIAALAPRVDPRSGSPWDAGVVRIVESKPRLRLEERRIGLVQMLLAKPQSRQYACLASAHEVPVAAVM